MPRSGYLLNFSQMDFRTVHEFQIDAVAARRNGALDRDLMITVEHPPVFTLGRRGGRQNILVDESVIRARGIDIVPIERGGDITYHAPGQWVVYLISDLKKAGFSVTRFVDAMEKAMVDAVGHWKVQASGNPAFRGIWVERRKLGSVGITVRHGITFHGLALNINTDLTPFSWINPCGIHGCEMTSLAKETGRPIDMIAAWTQIVEHMSRQFNLVLSETDLETLRGVIRG